MKQTDLVVQKERELTNLRIEMANLEARIASLNSALGGTKEALKSKDNEINRLTEESKNSEKVIVKTVTPNLKFDPYGRAVGPKIEYTNLKDVESEMRKDIEAKLKQSISDLENELLDSLIRIETLDREVARSTKRNNNAVEEEQDKARKKFGKLEAAHKEVVNDLKEELIKVKKDKTDEQVEAKRKEELTTLNETIDKLTKLLDESNKIGWFKKLTNKLFDRGTRKQVIKELEEAKALITRGSWITKSQYDSLTNQSNAKIKELEHQLRNANSKFNSYEAQRAWSERRERDMLYNHSNTVSRY